MKFDLAFAGSRFPGALTTYFFGFILLVMPCVSRSNANQFDGVGNRSFAANGSNNNFYAWDNRNRLSSVYIGIPNSGQPSVAYTYDPQNRRIEEFDFTSTTTQFTEFAYCRGARQNQPKWGAQNRPVL